MADKKKSSAPKLNFSFKNNKNSVFADALGAQPPLGNTNYRQVRVAHSIQID